ncbi:pleiotropic drug resistance protein 3-like [Telopea speciosissima]|uniref:pleiotropic drug resistance protein 3-like n=1 Tax=Telopea speciosissima TaxID=54955 RepID=UPI001CC74E23|nr:pleiotropic drug resistance protein 3-like [Telopea speciosissima]
MAQLAGDNEIESLRLELLELAAALRIRSSNSFESSTTPSSQRRMSSFGRLDDFDDEELNLQWAAIERLPTNERMRISLFDDYENQMPGCVDYDPNAKRVVDVTKLGSLERRIFVEKLIKHTEHDNLQLLKKLRKRIDDVGVLLPAVEVRYQNLCVEAACRVVYGKPLPTLWNSVIGKISDLIKLFSPKSEEIKLNILKDVSGIIKPRRMTLLLGPPGSGKTTLLLALSGRLDSSLKVTGEISYNGYKLEEFVPQKTSAYISQHDIHIGEMTVRETFDFAACCQGFGSRVETMMEVTRREKEAGIVPDTDLDIYMKGRRIQTDYFLKILGLDICADSLVGDTMRRGVSGGQKKRVTTGEMIIGPNKALFMDDISTGLDSSTTFQIISCVRHLIHLTDSTALISLLQPAPETYDLFDDIILIAEGKVVYHGPRSNILEFFEDCGFRCPERKGAADFLQEVISKKDQAQYWYRKEEPYSYISVDQFYKKFKAFHVGQKLDEEHSVPFNKSQSHENALSFSQYSLSKLELFKACMKREFLLMRRNSFVYVFRSSQIFIIAVVTMTVYIRTQLGVDEIHAINYLGSLFYGLLIILVDGFPELSMTVSRLAVFYRHRDSYFYPAWAYAIPTAILKIPLSFLDSLVWTALTYYVIGYSPEFGRFLRQFILLFALHTMSMSMFRLIASVARTIVLAITFGSFVVLFLFLFSGFVVPQKYMPSWLKWVYWVSPLSYGDIGITLNEFHAPRWQKMSGNTTIGYQTLETYGLNFPGYAYWICLGALFAFTIIFNVGFTLALTFLKPVGSSRAIISNEKLRKIQDGEDCSDHDAEDKATNANHKDNTQPQKGKMALPFEPLAVTFQDLQYYIDTPKAMRDRGITQKKLQLLHDITGSFRPGILTALMGVSGAGKTTLMDVLAGRKTAGTIEGDIRIGGYPKVQATFARVSGYCEQADIHSPQITVKESVIFSAWLRLSPEIDSKRRAEFVNEVLETIELDEIKDSLVGMPGVNGLSTEQRKRLTIAVELVANPSVIFVDEPTSGLDARAAAIVMRTVKNVVNTGRTVVCTIHQPSIDIFEAFDELILLKSGGRLIYAGPLGQNSCKVIEYFEAIPGVPKIKYNYNPATWMLEVSSISAEAELGVDFAQIYKESTFCQQNKERVKQLSTPPTGSKDLHFSTRYSRNCWGQFRACLWKQNLSYWRSPDYNVVRFIITIIASVLFGILFWKQGKKLDTQRELFNIVGSMYASVLLLGINNCSMVLPFVAIERTILYRERAAGMYSSWAYSFAQVVIELPYLFTQVFLYMIIAYPMIGFHSSAYKVFWFYYGMLCALVYFNYLGMLLVALTPNIHVAAILASACYTILNLFAGFFMPKKQIPKWWIWLYYICPTSWSLNGLFTSQYGDIQSEITVYGKTETIAAFSRDYFGYHHNLLHVVGILNVIYPLLFAALFAICIEKLNFQRR